MTYPIIFGILPLAILNMSKEILGISGTNLNTETKQTLNPYRKLLLTFASLIAAGYASLGCESTISKTPDLNKDPVKTTITKPTSTPEPLWIITLPKTPEPTPTPTPYPTSVRPIPTPEPAPSPTPEIKEIKYLMPGESFPKDYLIQNQSGKPEKKAFFYRVQKGDKDNLDLQIRAPWDPEKVIKEGEEISFPQGTTNITIAITPRPGVDESCYRKVILEKHSRNPGWTNLPINTETLAEEICVLKTLIPLLPHHDHDNIGGRVTSYYPTYNSSPFATQGFTFQINETECFEASERQFKINDQEVNQNQTITILPNGIARIVMYTTLSFKQKQLNPSPTNCPFDIQPVRTQ